MAGSENGKLRIAGQRTAGSLSLAIIQGILTGPRTRKTNGLRVATPSTGRPMNPCPQSARARACSSDFFAVAIVAGNFTYATGADPELTLAIYAKATMTTAGSTASALVVLPWIVASVRNC